MYNNLMLIQKGNNHYIDSRDVAELIGKQHKHLLRDIRNYCNAIKKIGQSIIGPSDFFVESSFLNAQNKVMPCYLLTKMGCEMVANKLTGEKGILFTAVYVSKFNEMETCLRTTCEYSNIPYTFTALQLAEIFGMYSLYGKPHAHAVSCIINENLFISHEHKIAISENYGNGVQSSFRYDEYALKAVDNWLTEQGYPTEIYGFERIYHVLYRSDN